MKRKVNLVGPTTLSISLPAKWVKLNSIKKGDELELSEEGSKLTIEAGVRPARVRSTTIDIHTMGSLTKRAFDAIYKRGYDEVIVQYREPIELKPILEAIGDEAKSFEIIKQEEGRCVLHSISELHPEEFQQLYRRTWLLLVEMCSEVANVIRSGKLSQLQELIALEKTNNRLTHVLRRSLNRLEYAQAKDAMLIYVVLEGLEKAADELKYLCKFGSTLKTAPKEVVDLCFKAAEFTANFQKTIQHPTQAEIGTIATQKEEIFSAAKVQMQKGNGAIISHHIMTYVGIIYDLTGPLVALQY